MGGIHLTQNEQVILYHLVAYPDASDREISQKVRLGISTVTKIRNRLLREGYLTAVNIPDVQKIGAEIMTIGYGEFNPNIPIDQKLERSQEWIDKITGTFLTIGDGNQAIGMGFYRNYTAGMESILMTKRLIGTEPMMTSGDINSLFISFGVAKFYRFFNYAPLLAKTLGIRDTDYSEPNFYMENTGDSHLTRKEKLVLYGLIKYPDHNDKNLGALLGISRQTISSVRKRFGRDGIITRRYIPNLVKLGFEVVVFAHIQMKNDVQMDPESLREALTEDNTITSICHGTDIVSISAFSNFADTKDRISTFLKDQKGQGLFTKEPIVYLWSANDLIYQISHDYHIPLSRILGIDPTSVPQPQDL
jgi:DNA-binding MarR family transcriptional regulator